MHRENDDLGLVGAGRHPPYYLQAGQSRHRKVYQKEIRVQLVDQVQGFKAVGGLGHDVDVGLGVEHCANPFAQHQVVIRYND